MNVLNAEWAEPFVFDDIVIEYYCGTYNGYIIVMMICKKLGHLDIHNSETVAGITFGYLEEESNFLTWKDGNFNSLQEAYDNGWLTKEDIESISDIYKLQREEKRGG